jgi:hypothetical protein
MTAAVGPTERPIRKRYCPRSRSCIFSNTPAVTEREKALYTASHGGNAVGSSPRRNLCPVRGSIHLPTPTGRNVLAYLVGPLTARTGRRLAPFGVRQIGTLR